MAMIDQLAQRVNNTVKQSQNNRSVLTKVADFFTDDDLDKTKYLGEVSKAREDIWNSQIMPKLKAAKANDATVSQAYRTWSKQVDDWSTSNGFKLRQGQSINQQRQQNMVQKLADADKSSSTSDKVAAKAKVAKVVTGTGLKSVQVGGLRAVGSIAQYVADAGETDRNSKRQKVANYVKRAGDEAKASNIAYQDIEQNGSEVSKIGLMAGEQVAPLVLTGGVAGATTKGALALGAGVKGAAAAGIGASTAVSYTQNYGDVRQGVEDEFRNATANQLATSKDPNTRTTFNSYYTKYLKKGLSQPDAAEQARLDTISDVAESYAEDYGKLVTALEPISAGAGKFGVKLAGGVAPNLVGKLATRAEQRAIGQAVKGQTSKVAAATAMTKSVTGAIGRSAAEEGAQEGLTDWASQKAAIDNGIKDKNDWGQTKEAAVYGAILGGLFGGGANIATGQTGYQQAKSQLSQIQQTQAATNAQLNTLQQQHSQLSQVANPTPEQKQQIQAIESNIRELETVKSDNETNAQRLNIPEPVLNKHVETPYNSTLNPQQAQTDNADNPAAPDTSATAQTASPTDTTTNTSASPVNTGANPENPSANGGFDVNQYLDLDANSLEQAWVNHQQEMADNATITDGTDQMSVQDAIEHANNTIAEENTTPQVQGGISGVVARNQQRQTQGELESEMEDWHAKKQQLQAERDAKLSQEMNTPDEPAIKLMDVNDGEHFDTTVIGLNGEPFRLANAWDSVIPAKAKQQAITTVFGGRLPQKLASASWGELHPQVQKKLHTWFAQELNNRRSEREQLAMPQLGMRTVNPQPVNELPSSNEPINLGFGNNQALTIPDMPVKQQSSNILANSAPSGDLFSQNSQDSQASIAAPKDVSIGADGQPKWFSTAQKANEFIAKKKIGDTHHVMQTDNKRFEILPKDEQAQTDINTTTDQQMVDKDNATDKVSDINKLIGIATKLGKYNQKNIDIILKSDGKPFPTLDTLERAIKNRKLDVADYDFVSESNQFIGVKKGSEASRLVNSEEDMPTPDYDTKVAANEKQSSDLRLQTTDVIGNVKGKPFKVRASAEKFQTENNLETTHEIKQVDGGFELHRLPIAKQNNIKDKANGIQDYTEIQSQVAKDMGIGVNADGEYDVTDEQFAEMNKRIDAIQREQRGLPPTKDKPANTKKAVLDEMQKSGHLEIVGLGDKSKSETPTNNNDLPIKNIGDTIKAKNGATYRIENINYTDMGGISSVGLTLITFKDGSMNPNKNPSIGTFTLGEFNRMFGGDFDLTPMPKAQDKTSTDYQAKIDSEIEKLKQDKSIFQTEWYKDTMLSARANAAIGKILDDNLPSDIGKDEFREILKNTYQAIKIDAMQQDMMPDINKDTTDKLEALQKVFAQQKEQLKTEAAKLGKYAFNQFSQIADIDRRLDIINSELNRRANNKNDTQAIVPKKLSGGLTYIGDNKDGTPLYEDDEGYRVQQVTNGLRNKETSTYTSKGIRPERRTDEFLTAQELKDKQPKSQPKTDIEKFADNKVFTADKVAAARARMKSKLSQLNSGLDPELMMDGMTIAGAYIESGVRKFGDYASAMIEDFGGNIKPYLLSFWESARHFPGLDTDGMTSVEDSKKEFDALIAKSDNEVNTEQDNTDDNSLRGTPRGRADSTAPASEPSQGTLAGISTEDVSPVPKTGDTTGQAQSSSRASVSSDESTRRSGIQTERSAGNRPTAVHPTATRSERVTPEPTQAVTADNTATDYPIAPPQSQDSSQDFTITESDEVGKGGLKTKFKQNLEAIKLLKQLQAENRQATKDEQKVLTKWVGWGGLKAAFRRGDGSTVNGWAKEVEQLEAVLTPDELDAALNSTIAAHYTEPKIVKAMWKAVEKLGFNGGRVLEPSIGSGIFLGMLPASLRKSTAFYGTELDTITGGLAQQLYPTAAIKVMGFQDYSLQDGFFKVAIGNPPFANIKITDLDRKHLSGLSLHNYFFAKSLDALEDNGVLAMVVTSRLLDGADPKTRNYLFDNAELLMAVRLPNNAFKENANTDVTTDIIFLRKRSEAERTNGITNDFDYRGVGKFTDKNGDVVPLNNYFIKNPDHMLGEFGNFGTMYARGENGIETALVAPKGQNTLELLNKVLDKLPTGVITKHNKSDTLIVESMVKNIPEVKVGSMFEQDGNIYERTPDSMGDRQAVAVELPSQKAVDRVTGLIGLRSILSDVRQMQLSSNTDETVLEQRRAELNKAYDQFVKEHGHINSDANKRLFKEDPSWSQLSALEDNYDKGISPAVSKNTGEPVKKPSAKKAAILERRTQYPFAEVTQVSSAKDGMIETLNSVGRLDLARISQLYGKDERAVIKELGDLIYQDPVQGWVTADNYLSGNVKAKLAQAKEAMAQYGSDYERNIKALEQVQPQDIEAVDIEVRPGAHWIPANHITDFLKDVLGATGLQGVPTYSKFDNDWTLPKFSESAEAGTQFGTNRKSVRDIVTAAMNGKQVTVYDQIDRDTKVVNQEATNDANQKVEAVKRAWNDWIWMDDNRRDELAGLYNDIFNTDINQTYDGSHLKLLGKVDDNVIELRPTQKNAIWRITQNPTTLLDHVVGAGKTFTMAAAAMELRRMGLASKPMIVVPNHLVGQWGKEFIQLYPNANILVATKKDFEAANRKRLVARIANGDWDAVIVAHSSFGKIAVSPEFEAEFIKQQIQEITTAIEDAKKDAGKSSNARDLANRRLKLEEKYKKLTASENRDTDNLYWDELGVDALMLDEAHEFKNLAYTTSSMSRVAGLGNQAGSQKAMDLFMKIQQLKQNPSSRIVFATGTPISNSMAEMYTMQRYLDMDRMKNQGIAGFDAWAKTFGEVVNDWELSASGKYQMKSRFAKFVNMPELMQSYLGFADVINRDDINDALKAQGKKLPVPKIKGGAPQNTVVERSDAQADFIGVPRIENGREIYGEHTLIYRAEHLPKGQDAKKKGADNMLKIIGEARKAALDMRILDPNAQDFAGSKVNKAVENIMRIWRDTAADKGTQLVFCDLSTPKGSNNKEQAKLNELVRLADEGNEDAIAQLEKYTPDELDAIMNVNSFSVYDDIKQKLINQGIPENEIAFIHDANTELQKDELFSKVRSGRVRVLLGSTSKMGAGTNVQTRLVALHHMDAPWRPSDLEQREGRIIRQGNELYAKDPENFEVEIHRYATEQTMDAMQWQIIENKAKFIEQVRKGDIKTRVIEDIEGEAANAGAMKAAASGNPLILEEMALKKQLNDLDSDKTRHDREQHRIKATIKRTKDSIESLENEQSRYTTLSQAKTPTEFDITVNGKNYKQGQEGARTDAGKAIISQAIKASMSKNKLTVGQYGDFTIYAAANPTNRDSAIISLGYQGESISIEVKHNDPAGGIITKLINRIKEIPDKLQQLKADLEKSIKAIPKLESQLKPWGKEAELDDIRRKHTEVMDALKPKKDGQQQPNDNPRYSKRVIRGATNTTPTQVRNTLVKQFGEKTVKALEDAGVLHIKQLSDFVDENGNLSIADDAEGFFHDGKAVLIADNIDANQIVSVFLHEVGGHAGLQNMLSPNAYANLMQTFDAMVARGDEIALRAKQRAELASENQDQATTEYLPYLLSEISNAQAKTPFIKRLLDRFVGAVRAWVYAKTGVRMNLTHADILGLAELTIKERARNIERTAKIAKQIKTQYSQPTTNQSIDDVNKTFNDELKHYVAGKLNGSHVFKLGYPNQILKSTGFPNQPIELRASKLSEKANTEWHKFDIAEVKDLPKALEHPLAVFYYYNQARNVITQIEVGGKQLLVGIHFTQNSKAIEINDIRGLFPKDNHEWLNWITESNPKGDSKLMYVDKQKIQALIDQQRTNLAEVEYLDLDLVESIVQKFENVNIPSYSRRFAPIQQSPIPNKPAAKKAADWLNLQWATKWVSWDTFSRLIRRNIATPQHVAITHADYKKFWDLVQQRINYTNYEAANAVGLVPEILDKRLIIGQNKKDIEAVSKVIFDGTMNDIVYGDTELTRKGLTDKQIDLYRRVRQAIDESVEKMAIDVLANSAKGTGLISLDEILRIKEAVLANGGNIAMFNNAMQQAVNAKIQAMQQAGVIDAVKAAKLTTMFNEVAKQMDDVENRVYDLQDKGYAPLMRFGSYAVAVNDSKGDLVLYELYETKREQQKALHDLKKNPDYAGMTFNQNVLNPGDYQQFTNKGLNPETVMLFANELGLSSDEANQAYLKVAIAQQSALKRLIHRKKVAGFSEDLPRVLSAFVMSNARHSARMIYNGDIEKSIQGVKDGDLRGEAQNLFENMENPKEEFASFRSMMFHWNMGFSPAFGLLNMTQPFIQTIPQLTIYDGVIGAHKSVLNGIRKAMASQVLEDAKGLGIAKNAKDFVDTIPSYMRDDYIRMTKEGHLDPQNVWLLQGLERGKAGVASGALGMVGQAAGYISEATETINRRATMYAALEIAHKLGAAKLKAKGFDSAYDFAVTTIQQTQGVYNKGNRSGLARSTGPASKFGAVIMMYKQFSINLIEQQIRMGQQKQAKALATAWVYQWLLAGAAGLIAADDLKDIIETIAFKFGYALNTDRKMQEFFIDTFGKEQGNDFYQMFNYGVLSSVSPIDFYGRSSAGNIIPATGLLHPSKAGDQKTEATEALGVGANWIGSMFDAGKLMMNGQFRDAMVTAAPRYIRDSVQAYEIATTGSMRDKNGRKVMDMTQGDAVAKALQFNPKSNAQRGREAMSNWQDKKLIENVKGDFTVKLAEAMASKDQAAQDKVMADIDKWNAKNDKQYQMDKTKITKSATEKAKKRDFTADERQTLPKSLEEYVNSLKKTG